MTDDLAKAVAEVLAGHAQRITIPGKYRVWRDGRLVVIQELGQ